MAQRIRFADCGSPGYDRHQNTLAVQLPEHEVILHFSTDSEMESQSREGLLRSLR